MGSQSIEIMKFLTSKLIPLLPFVLFILIYLNIYFFVYHVSQSPMMIIQDNDEEKLFEHENNNIPDHYLTKDSKPIKLNQTACVEYPAYFDLKFNNHHWQVLESSVETFYIYGAYLDDRPGVEEVSVIRILVSLESESPSRLFCQIWFQDEMIVSQINYIE